MMGKKKDLKEQFQTVVILLKNYQAQSSRLLPFGDTAQKQIPFTTDVDFVQAELKAINLENDFYAKGSSLNLVKDVLENTLKEERKKQNGDSKFVLFFITDGEITKEGEKLESFSSIREYISNGAIMGYGTESRRKNGK